MAVRVKSTVGPLPPEHADSNLQPTHSPYCLQKQQLKKNDAFGSNLFLV